jgi:hypothetical protein
MFNPGKKFRVKLLRLLKPSTSIRVIIGNPDYHERLPLVSHLQIDLPNHV